MEDITIILLIGVDFILEKRMAESLVEKGILPEYHVMI